MAVGEKDVESAVVTLPGETSPEFIVRICFCRCETEFGPESLNGLGTKRERLGKKEFDAGWWFEGVDQAITERDHVTGIHHCMAKEVHGAGIQSCISAKVLNSVAIKLKSHSSFTAPSATKAFEAGAGADASGMISDLVPTMSMVRPHIFLEGHFPGETVIENGDMIVVA